LGAALALRGVRDLLARSRSDLVDGRRLDPDTAAMLKLDELAGQTALVGRSPARVRREMHTQIRAVDGPAPERPRRERLSMKTANAALTARLYVPDGAPRPAPAVVYFHGGGWVVCDLDTHDGLCARIAEGGQCRVISVDYRLAPEHRFPTAVDDACEAVAWIRDNAERLGVDPSRIAVAGDSAGGNLSAVVARRMKDSVAWQVLLYPAVDASRSLPSHVSMGERYFLSQENIDWYLGHYLPKGTDLRHPDLSPLFAEDLAGAPPALVITAGFDPLRDEAKAYADRLRDAGVEVEYREHESLIHGFLLMTDAIPAAARATEALCRDVRSWASVCR
jgi:acetyl esterase